MQNGQNLSFKTPVRNIYVSIQGLEDPYIWVNTMERNSTVIYAYPYYTNTSNIVGGMIIILPIMCTNQSLNI